MSDNDLIMTALLEQNKIMGSIQADIASVKTSQTELKIDIKDWIVKHIADDKAVETRVVKLEGSVSKAKWALSILALGLSGMWHLITLYFTRTH